MKMCSWARMIQQQSNAAHARISHVLDNTNTY